MLGLVTIGQAPREDIVESMFGGEPGVATLQFGALDDLNAAEITALAPNLGETALVSRLRNGSEVVLGEHKLFQHVEAAIRRAEAHGCGVICVLCTGTFPSIESSAMVVFPDQVVSAVVNAVSPDLPLGVLMPHIDQEAMMQAKWAVGGRKVITAVASPYSAAHEIRQRMTTLTEAGAGLIVLDCMGFDRDMLAIAREATPVPVVLANAVVGAVLRELVD